ncbi:type II toxin-antitoxin system HicB family antitoxin [Desulfotruncus alcoholivorax]|uniref:type II toxin-antitoxin system HicB family antitoxin n=1 Tax=Desulfotruncus alcoholivorax TaxID=265477 RepID=UPI00041F6DC6|nr:type II toxin-antitoxin system HicB family antitoxin [Desulfotruncus alcoholivorax]
MRRRFKVVLTWDNETQVCVVTVPALPGCVTQGKDREEALERVQEAITGHIGLKDNWRAGTAGGL